MADSRALPETFPGLIQKHGEERGDQDALIFHHRKTSWADYAARVNRVANRLLQLGVGKGGRVAILGRNSDIYLTVMAGASTAGAVAIPMPTMVTPDTLSLMLEDCRPDILFVDQSMSDKLVEVLQVRPELGGQVVAMDSLMGQGDNVAQAFETWLGDAPADCPAVALLSNDPFVILYSSGTTGTPKGIILSHGTRIGQARNMSLLGYKVTAIATPLYSLGGMSAWMPTLYAGGCSVVVDKFQEQAFLALVERYRITHLLLVPVQFERLLAQDNFEDFDLSSIEFKFGGSAPMSLEAKRELAQRFPGEMLEFYSLTEGGVTTALWYSQAPGKLDSVGQPANGCVIRIIDEAGRELPTGSIGEIVGRSPVHMEGYLNRGDISDLLWTDGEGETYFRSGDLGFVDEEGFLFLRDRKKDMIISGGMNVYAADIEAVLHSHPDVAEAAVIGLPSTRWGESAVGLVVMRSSATGDALALQDWANGQLSASQKLAALEVRDVLPRNHLGKVLKRRLREELKHTMGMLP